MARPGDSEGDVGREGAGQFRPHLNQPRKQRAKAEYPRLG